MRIADALRCQRGGTHAVGTFLTPEDVSEGDGYARAGERSGSLSRSHDARGMASGRVRRTRHPMRGEVVPELVSDDLLSKVTPF
jgi:hypothetical protein